MRIIVLVKIVPKQTTLPMSSDYTVNREGAISSINPYDYYAIEEALRIKEKYGSEVIVLSLGNRSCERVLKEVYSLGVDQAILISDSVFKGADTFATSKVLVEAIRRIGHVDVVITGKKSSDGSTSQVPNEVAAILGWKSASNIVACNVIQNKVQVVERYEHYDIKKKYELPVVISVSTDINVPRLPTINGLLGAQKKEIDIWNNQNLRLDEEHCGIIGSKTVVVSIEKVAYTIQRKMQIITEREQIIESYRALRECSVKGKNSCKNALFEINEVSNKVVVVFCEVCNGVIRNESLYVVKKAALIAKKSGACIMTISTKLQDESRQLQELSKCGVKRNYELQIDNIYLSDKSEICEEILNICVRIKPEIILFASTQAGMNIAPYFAAMSETGLTAECIDIDYVGGKYLQKRPAFGGRLNANIHTKNSKYSVATIKPYVEQINVKHTGKIENAIVKVDIDNEEGVMVKKDNQYEFEQKIIIGCGNGIARQELVELVEKICFKRGYGFCATRELVDKGWATAHAQVGLTGQVISPQIYIAIGVSGAYEHVVGIEQSDVIISVNLNVEEPIVEVSDVVYKIDSEEFINILAMEENYEK